MLCVFDTSLAEHLQFSSDVLHTFFFVFSWAVPIRRDDLHAFFTLPNNAFCSTSSNTPADQLSRSASMPLLKSRGASLAESVALHVLSRLRYRTQSGHMVPLTLKVDHENSAAPSYISLDAAGLLPCSVSAAAHLPSRLPAVRSPVRFQFANVSK